MPNVRPVDPGPGGAGDRPAPLQPLPCRPGAGHPAYPHHRPGDAGHLRLRTDVDRDALQLRGPRGALQRGVGQRAVRRPQGDPHRRRRAAPPAGGRDRPGRRRRRRPRAGAQPRPPDPGRRRRVDRPAQPADRLDRPVPRRPVRGAPPRRDRAHPDPAPGRTAERAGRDRAGPRLARRARRAPARDRAADVRRLVGGQRTPARRRARHRARGRGLRRQRPDVDRAALRAPRARAPGAARTSA